MTEHTNSNDAADRTTTTADAPAPKLAGDKPRARPDHIDTADPDGVTYTADQYAIAASGPFAGIAREDLDAPAVLCHIVEDANGDRSIAVCHRDSAIPAKKAEEMAEFTAAFYDLDHSAMKPGTLVSIYEDLLDPAHGGPYIAMSFGLLGPHAATIDPDPRMVNPGDHLRTDVTEDPDDPDPEPEPWEVTRERVRKANENAFRERERDDRDQLDDDHDAGDHD